MAKNDVLHKARSVDRQSAWSRSALRFAPFAAALIAFAIYYLTLAPGITTQHNGADSGDLATAAFVLGIPHPPGYPLFTLLAALFAHLPFWEPARGVGLLSALAAAFAVFILAQAGFPLSRQVPRVRTTDDYGSPLEGDSAAGSVEDGSQDLRRMLIASLAALGLAFGPLLWSQATIPEVYTLNLLLVALVLLAMVGRGSWRIPLAAAAFGLGLAHHPTIILLAPGAWLALRPTRRDWRALMLLLAPLLLYAYLPIRALAHPPVNWGNPSTLEGFIWDVTAAPYRSYFLNEGTSSAASRVFYAASLLFQQFNPFGVLIALWGLARMGQGMPRLAIALGLDALLILVYAVLYVSTDSFLYLLPLMAIVLLCLVYGAVDLVESWMGFPRWVGVALVALLPIWNLAFYYPQMDLSQDAAGYQYESRIFDILPRDAILFVGNEIELFPLTYYRYVLARDRSTAVVLSDSLLQFDWYYEEAQYRLRLSLPPAGATKGAEARTAAIAQAGADAGRRVCFTFLTATPEGFRYEEAGKLKCVAGAGK